MSEPTWELLGGGGVIGGPIDYVGDWAAGTTYQPGQVVRFAGVDYLAVNPSTGQVPPRASAPPVGMVCIYDNKLAADAPSFDVTNIPQDYAHLDIVISGRTTEAVANSVLIMRLNGDTGNNYDLEMLYANSASILAAAYEGNNSVDAGRIAGASAPAGTAGRSIIELPDYTNPSFWKGGFVRAFIRNAAGAAAFYEFITGYQWRSVAPVNRITIQPSNAVNFVAGTRLTIYGRLSQGQAPPVTTLAPGGIGTSFPVSPANGELFTLVDSLTAPTYAWECRYVASITDAYKWLVVGGDAKMIRAETDYPANAALILSVPRPGIYNLESGGMIYALVADTIYSCDLTVDALGASYAYTTARAVNGAGSMFPLYARHPNVTVAATITQRSNVASGARLERRSVSAMPVRLS